MSNQNKLQKDYDSFVAEIESQAKSQIDKIEQKGNAIKEEARKTGESAELSLSPTGTKH